MKQLALALLFMMGLGIDAFSQSVDVLDFYIKNDTGYRIYSIYCSPSDVSTWDEDLIDGEVLYDGQTADITFTGEDYDTTIYNIKIMDEFGDEVVVRSLNLVDIWGMRVYNDDKWSLQVEIDYIEN